MNKEEQEYLDKIKEDGVEIEETEESEEESEEQEESNEEESQEEESEEEESEEKSTLTTKERRSIYDEYKDKKSELKSEKELREKAEQEKVELQTKLDALENAGTKEEKDDAKDEIDAFMSKHKEWDKGAITELMELTRKGLKPEIPEDLSNDIKEFKEWKEQNKGQEEKLQFENEFKSVLPSIKTDFPKASDKELEAIKDKLNKLYHTEGWNDKDLDYILFKNKKDLSALVSPKKKGIETGETEEEGIQTETDFDPNADISKLSLKAQEKWMKEYEKASQQDGLQKDSEGRLTM